MILPDEKEAVLVGADQSVWKPFDRSEGPHADIRGYQVLRPYRADKQTSKSSQNKSMLNPQTVAAKEWKENMQVLSNATGSCRTAGRAAEWNQLLSAASRPVWRQTGPPQPGPDPGRAASGRDWSCTATC